MRLVTTLGLLLLAACSPTVDLGHDDAPDAATPPDATMSADAGEPGQDASLCPGFEGETLEVQPRLWSWDPVTGAKSWECSLALIGFPAAGRSDVLAFTNHGTAPLTFSNLRIQQDPTKDEAFSLEGPAEFILAPCASAMVWVRFAPATRDHYVGRLEYSSNDPIRPTGHCVLTGQGVGPNITVEPTKIDFGLVEVGQSQVRLVTVSNTGVDTAGTNDDDLKLIRPDPTSRCSKSTDCVSNICFRGACWVEAFPVVESAGDFIVSVGPPEGYTPFGIPAEQSADLKVRFAPRGPGPKSGRLTIYSNDPARPAVVVEVVGTGICPSGTEARDRACFAISPVTYTVTSPVPQRPPTVAGWTEVALLDAQGVENSDTGVATLSFPFSVRFFDRCYDQVDVTMDGLFVFEPGSPKTCTGGLVPSCYLPKSFPDPALPNGLFAPWMDDMQMIGRGKVEVVTSAPSRVFSVRWRDWRHDASNSVRTLQVDFHETGNLAVYYGAIASTAGSSEHAGVGMEDPTGTRGLHGLACSQTTSMCGSQDWPAGQMIVFTPSIATCP